MTDAAGNSVAAGVSAVHMAALMPQARVATHLTLDYIRARVFGALVVVSETSVTVGGSCSSQPAT